MAAKHRFFIVRGEDDLKEVENVLNDGWHIKSRYEVDVDSLATSTESVNRSVYHLVDTE